MSDSKIRLGVWQTFQNRGALATSPSAGVRGRVGPECRDFLAHLCFEYTFSKQKVCSQISTKVVLEGPICHWYTLSARRSEWRLKRSAGLRPSASRFVPKLVDSAKTAEPKMAFNFAHLLSAACGGAPHRLRRLRRPWARCPRAPLFWGGSARKRQVDLYTGFQR